MTTGDHGGLLLGPILRHVGTTTASVWVEVATPGEVEVLGHTARTFTVQGRHYALVVVRDLEPGTCRTYEVHLDGARVWPLEHAGTPASRIRTRATTAVVADPARQRIVFGSCRYPPTGDPELEREYGVDALDAYAARLLARVRNAASGVDAAAELPDALCLLGDRDLRRRTDPADPGVDPRPA